MYECVIVGGGIESIVQAIWQEDYYNRVAFVTDNSFDFSKRSTTWQNSHRHISIFEGINFLSPGHRYNLEKSIEQGGWLCKTNNLNPEESLWLENRKKLCKSRAAESFFNKFNRISVKKWNEFIRNNKQLMDGTQLNYGVSLRSNNHDTRYSEESFSFDAGKFCKNAISYLRDKKVSFFFNSKITGIEFDDKNRIKYITSKDGKTFQAKNYIFCPGAYGDLLFRIFNLNHRVNGALGIWAIVEGVDIKKPFKYHYFENGQLKTCQSYTPLNNEDVIVGSGCAWVGNNFDNICEFQRSIFIDNQKKIIEKIFPGKNVRIINDNCIRAFSDDNLPIIKSGNTSLNGRYFLISGTGTFAAAYAILTAEKCFREANRGSLFS